MSDALEKLGPLLDRLQEAAHRDESPFGSHHVAPARKAVEAEIRELLAGRDRLRGEVADLERAEEERAEHE